MACLFYLSPKIFMSLILTSPLSLIPQQSTILYFQKKFQIQISTDQSTSMHQHHHQFAQQNTAQANNWATQRRDAIEKAKRLRDDHKYSLALTGKMSLGNLSFEISLLHSFKAAVNLAFPLINTAFQASEAQGQHLLCLSQQSQKDILGQIHMVMVTDAL